MLEADGFILHRRGLFEILEPKATQWGPEVRFPERPVLCHYPRPGNLKNIIQLRLSHFQVSQHLVRNGQSYIHSSGQADGKEFWVLDQPPNDNRPLHRHLGIKHCFWSGSETHRWIGHASHHGRAQGVREVAVCRGWDELWSPRESPGGAPHHRRLTPCEWTLMPFTEAWTIQKVRGLK